MGTGRAGLGVAVAVLCVAGSLPAAQHSDQIPLPVERASNVFFARATVNGRGPFWFTVDTGATLTVIDPQTAVRAGLAVRPEGRRPNVGVGSDDTDLATTSGAVIRIAGLPDFAPTQLYVVPVRAGAGALGHAIDGVLGTDVLRGHVVEFDYAASRVVLSPSRGGPDDAAAGGVAISLRGNVLLAPAALALPDGRRVQSRLLIDTGSNGSLTLTSPFVRQHALASRFKSDRASLAVGINGTTFAPVIQLASIAFGDAIIRGPDAALSGAESGLHASADFDGILGAELLRRFRVVIDYPRRRLHLHPPE